MLYNRSWRSKTISHRHGHGQRSTHRNRHRHRPEYHSATPGMAADGKRGREGGMTGGRENKMILHRHRHRHRHRN